MSLPSLIIDACDILRLHIRAPWDAEDGMEDSYVRQSPLGCLINAYESLQSPGIHALKWLSLFVARRALPCWELYCDNLVPLDAVRSAEEWLVTGVRPTDVSTFTIATKPAYRGRPIRDCRWADTSCVSDAVVELFRFLISGNTLNAIYCISAADAAFDQSPLGAKDPFREWLLDYAIPLSFNNRDMTEAERDALRRYNTSEIPATREKEASFWNHGF
jgi:hypothetical protein